MLGPALVESVTLVSVILESTVLVTTLLESVSLTSMLYSPIIDPDWRWCNSGTNANDDSSSDPLLFILSSRLELSFDKYKRTFLLPSTATESLLLTLHALSSVKILFPGRSVSFDDGWTNPVNHFPEWVSEFLNSWSKLLHTLRVLNYYQT